jgi:hypothetical protein
MKHLCSFFLLSLGLAFNAPAQQTLFDLTAASTEIPYGFETIFDLDVAKYYQLSGDYSSEPKKAAFKETQWYRTRLSALKTVRDSVLKKQYCVHLIMKFNENNYDTKRKGFDIELGTNVARAEAPARPPKSVYGFVFNALPLRQEHSTGLPPGGYAEKLFLPMSLEQGREIASNREYMDVYFFFTPTVREKITFSYLTSDSTWHKTSTNNMKADRVRVVVANTATGTLYYDKTFVTQVAVNKKK